MRKETYKQLAIGLRDLRQHTGVLSDLCDVTLEVKGRQMVGHRVVMAAVSQELHSIFQRQLCHEKGIDIKLESLADENLLLLVYPDKTSPSSIVDNESTYLRINSQALLTLMRRMNNMRKNREFCDLVLKVENQEFAVHRVVLGVRCSYFRCLFTSDMRERKQRVVKLDILQTESVVEDLLVYIYTGEIELTAGSALELLVAADYLLLDELKTKCAMFLCTAQTIDNVLHMYRLAKRYDCMNLLNAAEIFVAKNFTEVSNNDLFPSLTAKELEEFLSSDKLDIKGEERAYIALKSWTYYNVKERSKFFSSIFQQQIRLSLINKKFLRKVILKDPLVRGNTACYNSVNEHLSCGQPRHATLPRPRCGYAEHFVAFLNWTGKDKKSLYFYNSKKNSYLELAPLPLTCPNTAPASLLCCNGNIFAVGERFAFRYDEPKNKWSTVAPAPFYQHKPQSIRCLGLQGVAALGEFLYLVVAYEDLGMRSPFSEQSPLTGTTWRYNSTTDTWDTVAALGYPRDFPCLVSCGRFLYAIGGLGLGPDLLWSADLVERYDPSKDQWSEMSPMKEGIPVCPRGVAVNEKIFVMDQFGSFQLYNTFSDQWQIIPNPPTARYWAAIGTDSEKIYVFGGLTEKRRRKVDVYDVTTSKWIKNGSVPKIGLSTNCCTKHVHKSSLRTANWRCAIM